MEVDGAPNESREADDTESSLKLKRSHQTKDDTDSVNSEPGKKKSKADDDVTKHICNDSNNKNKDVIPQQNSSDTKTDEMDTKEKQELSSTLSESIDRNSSASFQQPESTDTDTALDHNSPKDNDKDEKAGSSHQSDGGSNTESNASLTSTSTTAPSDFGERKTEVDVGITEYLGSQTQSFSAVIKQRYSDFIVNEIDENGSVVHLKNITPEEDEEDEKEDNKATNESLGDLSETDQEAIQKIVTDGNKEASHNILAPEDKSMRTKIHLAIKHTFTQLETSTTDNEKGQKVIKVTWRKGKTRDVIRDEWPQSKKSCRYVRFVLYKENKDTMDAIGLIAKNLKVRESMFQYAGSKDKRAKTSQEITAHRIHPKKLVNLNKVLWNMGLGDFRYVEHPLQLGQLSGNRFTIVLRNIQASVDTVDTALTSLKVVGFINYFGMQRFGTTAIPTHRIGSALLKGDWEGAIDLILAPRNDVAAKDKFQKHWAQTRDPATTLDVTPRYCGLERNILEALRKKAKPFNALERLPRNTRLLYLHSYQSLVWNKMTSRRLAELGRGVVPGDLVMGRQLWADKGQNAPSPVVVTDENKDKYAVTDVVLPLPGYDVMYPHNQVGDWYKELLSSDGLDIGNMKRSQKDYSLSGAYRHLVVIPQDVSWTHNRYDDYTKPLTLSDLDRIYGEPLPYSLDKGAQRAVVLHMSLPSSCYATMALREAMRIDTSSVHQTSLNETS